MTSRASVEDESLIEWQPLPYAADALQPHLSAAALTMHHAHHYRAAVGATNNLIAGTSFAALSLDDIVCRTAGRPEHRQLAYAAAEAWNHAFYFSSMRPGGGGPAQGWLGALVERQYKSQDNFADAVIEAAFDVMGSGWLWLTFAGSRLDIGVTSNAECPIARGVTPLIGIDLWEHAYALDHQSRRGEYVTRFLAGLVNWDFASANLERAVAASQAAQ